jgi:hypothetical protein
MNETIPADLNAAIAMQAAWLQAWVMVLVIVNLAAALFLVARQDGKFSSRAEVLAILVSFFAAGAFMSWLYEQLGYVRLLGLPHLVFWLPVYIWLVIKFRRNEFTPPFKHYLILYFLVAGISLVLDFVDVLRYLMGER